MELHRNVCRWYLSFLRSISRDRASFLMQIQFIIRTKFPLLLSVPRLCNSSHFSALYLRTLDHNVIQVSFIRFIDQYQSWGFLICRSFYFRTMTGSKMLFACLALIAFLHPLVHVASAQGLYFELSLSMHFKFQYDLVT